MKSFETERAIDINRDEKLGDLSNNFLDGDMEASDEDGEEDEALESNARLFIMTIKPKSNLCFNLEFMPKDVRDYVFNIPL